MLRIIRSNRKIKILQNTIIFRYTKKNAASTYIDVTAPTDLEKTGNEWLQWIVDNSAGKITSVDTTQEFITFIASYIPAEAIHNFQIYDSYLAHYLGFPNVQINSLALSGYTSETWGYFRLLFEDDGFIGNEYEESQIEDHESGITMDGKVYQPCVYYEPTIYNISLYNFDINQTRWAKRFLRSLGSNTDCYFETQAMYPEPFPADYQTPFQISAESKYLEKSDRHNSNNIKMKMVWAGEVIDE